MRKLVLTAIVATVGCSAAGQPQPTESIARSTQSVTASDDDGRSKIPKLRWVTPGQESSDGGVSGSSGGGTLVSHWQTLNNAAPFYAGTALLLTDGTVLVQDQGTTPGWWKLTPDSSGSYLNGTWTQTAPPPNGYQPAYYASAVLPDGRVIFEGGEYLSWNDAETTQGAIYDPVKDQWTSVAPPAGWTTIGDADSVVLADGRFYLADCCSKNAAVLDPKTLTWTPFGMTGKADANSEEGWTLLPDGDLLTVDTTNFADMKHTEIFSPRTATWTSAGDTPALLADIATTGSPSFEMGPQLLRPDGTVFAVGATGHNAVYHVSTGRWTAAPDFPNIPGQGQLDTADGPAALLPDGHVLVVTSPGVYQAPIHMFEFDGASLAEIAAPPNAPNDSSYYGSFLVLPTGQILFTDFSNDIEIYTPPAGEAQAQCDWAPQIDSRCGLETLELGKTYSISGTQLHGLSAGAAYGDDEQAATNYPLVRVSYRATGHVSYLRTHDHSSMSIARGAYGSTSFDVSATQETGEAELVVVANGVASAPISVKIAR